MQPGRLHQNVDCLSRIHSVMTIPELVDTPPNHSSIIERSAL